MKMYKVESSNLAKIGYDPDKEVLVAEFIKGGIYEYKRVPEEIFKMIMDAPSKGSAFHRYIRSNQVYKYKKVG